MVERYLSTGLYDCATLTHSETSTGVMNDIETLAAVFRKYPEVVWCVDCVSSFAGVRVDVDRLGIDVMVTSSQKCLALPPGLSLCTVSTRAEERAKGVKNRGFYFDLVNLLNFIREKNFQYPSTMTIPHLFALDVQMERIAKEGIENRYRRHREMAARVQSWAKRHFALYPAEPWASTTVTCIRNTRGISVADLNQVVSDVIANHLSDPRITGFVSVTRVEVLADMRSAEVYLSVFASDGGAKDRTFTAITHARTRIQSFLAEALESKFCPVLRFHVDEQFRKTLDVMRLIDEVAGERRKLEDAEPQE